MGNVVAARRLRKSMLKESDAKYNDPLQELVGNEYISKNCENENIGEKNNKFKINFKTRVIIKVFLAVLIVFSCLICKLIIGEKILDNRYVSKIVNEYKKDYSREYLLTKLENYTRNIYPNISNIIPESVCFKIKEKYHYIKPKILEFNVKEKIYTIIYQGQTIETLSKTVDNEGNKEEQIKEIFDGIGGGEPIEIINESSAVSMMQDDVATVLSKNINISLPVTGTITSEYGARDQIFEGVNSYHTGIDIANALGTEIKSATDGKVYKTQSMDKYYGNNIEIENNGVIFKYAHLSEIKVKEGDEIKQGDIIGLMGTTGMSTGSHLHFEIIVDSRTIDPRKLVNF